MIPRIETIYALSFFTTTTKKMNQINGMLETISLTNIKKFQHETKHIYISQKKKQYI